MWISIGLCIGLSWAEFYFPRRKLKFPRRRRWPNNLGLALFNALLTSLVFPLGAIRVAFFAQTHSFGLLNTVTLFPWLETLLALILLDLAIYGQHVLFHRVPGCWKVHRMHHSDLDYDFTTGSRFHPLEILLSLAIKLGVICLIGASTSAVLLFEILLNASSLFNHSNLKIPLSVDTFLRHFLVTPDMHRIHHSLFSEETNRNFGFCLPWWDHLFKTYQQEPRGGQEKIQFGIELFRQSKELRFDKLITQPFR